MMAGKQFDPEKDKYWRKMLASHKASGLRLSEFCERAGIKPNTFCNWRQIIAKRNEEFAAKKKFANPAETAPSDSRLRSAGMSVPTVVDFLPIILKEQRQAEKLPEAVLELSFKSGAVVSVREYCSPALLATVMELMENTNV